MKPKNKKYKIGRFARMLLKPSLIPYNTKEKISIDLNDKFLEILKEGTKILDKHLDKDLKPSDK